MRVKCIQRCLLACSWRLLEVPCRGAASSIPTFVAISVLLVGCSVDDPYNVIAALERQQAASD